MKLPRGWTWRYLAFAYGVNAFTIALNLWLAHGNAQTGRDILLFINCCALLMGVSAIRSTTRTLRRCMRLERGEE